jgi:hypothetical protein
MQEVYITGRKRYFSSSISFYMLKKQDTKLLQSVEEMAKENNNDFTAYVNAAFDLSMFTSKDKLNAFLEIPSEE